MVGWLVFPRQISRSVCYRLCICSICTRGIKKAGKFLESLFHGHSWLQKEKASTLESFSWTFQIVFGVDVSLSSCLKRIKWVTEDVCTLRRKRLKVNKATCRVKRKDTDVDRFLGNSSFQLSLLFFMFCLFVSVTHLSLQYMQYRY